MKLINKFGTCLFNVCFSGIGSIFSMGYVKHLPLAILLTVILWITGICLSIYEVKNDILYF